MVNVYVFRNDATTPPDWTEIAAEKRDRLILGGGTPLSTGGADSHGHTLTNFGVSTLANDTQWGWSTTGENVPYGSSSHNHDVDTSSVDLGNNLPPYKNLRLVYRSVTGWSGKIPAGSIVFREEVPANYTRVDPSETYFIRIAATAGGTGGSNDHNHLCYVSLANWTAPTVRLPSTASPQKSVTISPHGHGSAGGYSDSAAFDYKYWGCGLISADNEQPVKANSYLLFDGTPDAGTWETIDFSGRYLLCKGDYTIGTGGTNTTLTHTHNLSMTSAGSNACRHDVRDVTSAVGYSCSHTHTITAMLDSQEIQPSYVNLILARAKVDLGSVTRAIFVITC